ncbi:MAG: RNA polymerase sigma factor RpoH [Alphaproteobacteria bacterium]|nr:RNA polymerase sigma factor RpoH [Alphaproteobacteria bacterium]
MATNLPTLSSDASLTQYLREINEFPMLEKDEEYSLAKKWVEKGDVAAAHRLVTSHLRFVAKIAMGYRGYGLPVSDLIAEGNIGLMQAVKRFDPDKGFRLSTYAMWWIKASIQEYVLRSWSLVKIGTSATQKRLFFNLRRLKNKLQDYQHNTLTPENVTKVAKELDVSEEDVRDMDMRFSVSDRQLNAPISGEEGTSEYMDMLASEEESQETQLVEWQERGNRQMLLANAIATLNEREQDILTRRRLQEPPATLEELSQEHSISRERVRQIEVRAMEKLHTAITAEANAKGLPAPKQALPA